MNNWQKVKLKDVVSILGDGLHGTPTYDDSGEYFFINGNNLFSGKIKIKADTKRINANEYLKYKKELNDRTLLVSINGTIGNVATYRGEKCILGKSACYFNILPEVCKGYIYYILLHDDFQNYAKNWAAGTTIKNVSLKQMREYEFLLPSFEKQQQIVQILSSLDDKIELNAQINHNLEEQAKALYDQIWDNYDSGTWSSAKAEDLFDISIGKTPPRKESQWFSENDNDIVWVSIADMGQSGCFISNSSEYLTPDAVSKFNVKRVPAGAILLSFKLTVGRVAITGCELTTNEAIAHFRMEDSTIREYLYFYLKHFNYQTMGSTSSIATAVNSKMVKAMRIDIPARETLENFHSTVFPMFEQIEQNQQEIQTLAQLRDTLLPKLMSGELDVSEVEV